MKNPLRLALLASVLAVTASAQTVVGQWRFGEADAGATNGGSVGATTTATVGSDLSLSSGTATYTSSTPGAGSTLATSFGSSTQFSTSSYDSLTNGSSFIMELWFKPTALTGNQYLVYNGNPSFRGVGLFLSGSTMHILSGGNFDNAVGGTVTAGQWNYAALVWDNGNARVFVNNTATPTYNQTRNFTASAVAGGDTLLYGINFTGAMDEARISTFTSGTFNASMLNTASVVPEPSTYAALAGLAALGVVAWRRRQARA